MAASPTELEEVVAIARSLFARGYSFGTAGNISIRSGDTVYATPTGSSFGTLTVEALATCDLEGRATGPNRPTKELLLHLAAYRARPESRAVVHLHSTYATAAASMRELDEENALPMLTAYYAMRVPSLPTVPYLPPGDAGLATEVERLARQTPAMLMRNHGSIAIGNTLQEAAALAEEIEETARLFFLLGERAHPLTAAQISELPAKVLVMGIFVAAIADDDTGATDLAGMLTEQGMRVVLLLEDVSAVQLARWTQACDAVVLGTASRSIARAEAYARTAKAARTLRQLGPAVMAVKYCSTFDSTSEGNIGASIDAAMDVTGAKFTIALPALPALGRTTYMGYHFVGQQLLSDSSLRHHPLNPMTNPHLPSHLRTQTHREVGLLAYPDEHGSADTTRGRLEAIEREGIEIAILDCVDDEHLRHLGEAISDLPLLTGSSAWAMVLPEVWREQGRWVPSSANHMPMRTEGGSGFLVVSGSCSEATLAQNAWAKEHGIAAVELPALELAQDAAPSSSIVAEVVGTLAADRPCLLSTTGISSKEEVHRAAAERGLSPAAASERIGQLVADTVTRVFAEIQPRGLIVAGGETSSTLMRALGLGGLRVGPNIEPGVPVCVALAAPYLGVALKSGNFGSVDFYARAIEAIRALPARAVGETEEIM